MQNRHRGSCHRGSCHRGSGISSHGSGSSVAVAVASMGSGEGVASGQGVGSVPRGQDGGLRRDGSRKGKDGNLYIEKFRIFHCFLKISPLV